ncbi:MAG: alcohol dehydrogenase catalytic domain-containing protein [Clostridia bacterium]|nr:alcohol dehydrogenase catalytic domain-containing protein [Clostridia bacterium]
MKKLVLTDFNKVEIVEAPIPEPAPGQAVVKIRYAGICGSDLHVFAGQHPTAKPPLVMGHEAMGTLYSINSERKDVKVGDKVCVHTVQPCNSCEGCVTGRENLCTNVKIMGTSLDGVFTQYICVNADRVIKFEDGVDDKIAAVVEPLTVGVHDIRRSGLKPGESVLISGAGPIGLIIAIMAGFSGASRIALVEKDPARIELAKNLGYSVFSSDDPDLKKKLVVFSGEDGFDKSFEVAAVESSFRLCIDLLKRGGVCTQVGMPPKGRQWALDIDKIIYSECEIHGVRHHTMNDMQVAAKIINSGVLNGTLSKLVSAIYPLEQAMDAFKRAESDKTMLRVLIKFEED